MSFLTEFIAIPSIAVICYLVSIGYKNFTPDIYHKHIPTLCGVLGAILGVVAYIFTGSLELATDWMQALAIGIVSGLSATGANQIYKQNKRVE